MANTIYFVNSEVSIPLFKQAAQTLGATISTSLLAFKTTCGESSNLTMTQIDGFFDVTQTSVEVYALNLGDSIVFELPTFAISQEIATGISIYIANIAQLVEAGTTNTGAINISFYTPLLGQKTPAPV
jgi:hypothetical protein